MSAFKYLAKLDVVVCLVGYCQSAVWATWSKRQLEVHMATYWQFEQLQTFNGRLLTMVNYGW